MFPRDLMASFDHDTDSFSFIDAIHRMVHRGKMFISSYKTPDASPISDNASILLALTVGDVEAHCVFSGSCGGEGELELFERNTISSPGTVISVVGMHREKGTYTPKVSARHTPTVSAYGPRLYNILIPGGTAQGGRVGSLARDNTEWILAPSTNYVLRVTNRSGSAQQMSLSAQWYEVED